MGTIQQKELRNDVGAVLRRVEAGERLTVTVAGRPVAELAPLRRHRWISGPALDEIWHSPSPHALEQDLSQFEAVVVDPYS